MRGSGSRRRWLLAVVLVALASAARADPLPQQVYYSTFTTYAGLPFSMTPDPAGNAYILSDIGVSEVSPQGAISSLAGAVSGVAYFPIALAVNPASEAVYYTWQDWNFLGNNVTGNYIVRVGSGTVQVPTTAYASYVSGVAVDSTTGHVYVVETYSNDAAQYTNGVQVLEYDSALNGPLHSADIDPGAPVDIQAFGQSAVTDGSGNIYVVATQCGSPLMSPPCALLAVKFSPHLAGKLYSSLVSIGVPGNFPFSEDIAVNPAGEAFIAGVTPLSGVGANGSNYYTGGVLVKLNPAGATDFVRNTLGLASGTQNSDIYAVAADADGDGYVLANLYSSNYPYESIAHAVKYSTGGAVAWNFPVFNGLAGREGTANATDAQGNVYLAGISQGSATYFDAATIAAKYGQVSQKLLRISTGALTVSPAPPTYPGVQLSGNPSTTVEIDLLDATGAPLPQQAAVDLAVTEAPLSGGHAHDNARPVGTLSWQGGPASSSMTATTNASGQLFVVYASTSFGGQEKITATLASDASVSTSTVMNIAVVDSQGAALFDLSTYPIAPYAYFTGNTQQTTYAGCPGYSTRNHPSNHWATEDTAARAVGAIMEFYNKTRIALGINDMGLPSGGIFDICGDWQLTTYIPSGKTTPTIKGHKCHRGGNSIDIDSANLTDDQIDILDAMMEKFGGEYVDEGPIHYQFPGLETCFGSGGP